MSLSPLLYYYQRELSYLRNRGAQFAKQYPKIARRLELSANDIADPHIERLIESFAFLTGKIQRDLDDLFPQISQNLLDVLYPHMVKSLPSVTTMCFKPDKKQSQSATGVVIPRLFPLFAESSTDETCWYRLAKKLTVFPMDLEKIAMCHPQTLGVRIGKGLGAQCLHLRFEDLSGNGIYTYAPQSVCLHLSGDNRVKHLLYEAILNQSEIQILCGDLSKGIDTMKPLPRGSCAPKGFDDDETLIHNNQSNVYALLQEYFHYPDKFLYFEINHLKTHLCDEKLDLILSLNTHTSLVNEDITQNNILYGCVPAVNLFASTSEPINMDHAAVEYRLVGDYRREHTTEIHSIEKVYGSKDHDDLSFEIHPYFSMQHHTYTAESIFYHARSIPTTHPHMKGGDHLISFIDENFNPLTTSNQTIYADILCTNRRLSENISAQTAFFAEGEGVAGYTIFCLDKPTSPTNPITDGQTQWKLISQLGLNHMSLEGGENGLKRFRETLFLHCHNSIQEVELQGIKKFEMTTGIHRLGQEAWRGFVQGTEIKLHLDTSAFTGSSAFLFSHVLSRFFSQYAHINSFVQLVVYKDNHPKEWIRWPARKGNSPLV